MPCETSNNVSPSSVLKTMTMSRDWTPACRPIESDEEAEQRRAALRAALEDGDE
jgi:hypothetical protein